ncbi:MAG: ATP-binding cassette domain-containing protein [Planctomycetaceae bacterium]
MIELSGLSIRAGRFALADVSLSVSAGSYGVLMGPTGCGKTTLLEAILGLRRIESGTVRLQGRDVTQLDPAMRGIGYVPQDAALFPRMTVAEQLGFALTVRRVDRKIVAQSTGELAAMLQIPHLLDRYPTGLSGGERQRVALGRALSFRPGVLCLDEPLSALDTETRGRMCQLLRDVQRQTGVTVLHVTHHLDEARSLADELLRLESGRVVRQPPPSAVAVPTPGESLMLAGGVDSELNAPSRGAPVRRGNG